MIEPFARSQSPFFNTVLAQTPLFDWHASHGGRMVDFAGWSMPVQYTSIVAEHNATRRSASLFDISHMGRLRFDGSGAAALLDSLVTRRVADQKTGQVRYSLVTAETGGILDDVLVYHLADAGGGSYWLMVVNASNRTKIVDWIESRLHGESELQRGPLTLPSPARGEGSRSSAEVRPEDIPLTLPSPPRGEGSNVAMSDVTVDWAMIAVQGPRAVELVQPLVELPIGGLKYYHGAETRIAGHGGIVSRTGYTGEDGYELILGARAVEGVWQGLVDAGAMPAGLGARDTLRLEAGMPLYGHELNESIDPYQAGLDFAVDLEGRTFPGHEALARIAQDQTTPRRVGLVLEGKRAGREGFEILSAGNVVGRVTSGTFSPTLERPIAMGYVAREFAEPGTELAIDIRGRAEPARVVALPFYRRGTKGSST